MSDLTCEQCQRPIRVDEPFEQVPGVTVPRGAFVQHTACPPGTCATCQSVRPYAELRIANLGGAGEDDPDLLACTDVIACQVRAGERDPDDVPQGAR